MKPNIIYIFADQWRKQAAGFMGEDPVITPNIDRFAQESLVFNHALSCTPLCSPHRAALMTGRYPQSTGVYTNCKIGADIMLSPDEVCVGDALKAAGYQTGYIGKWHLDLPEQNRCPEPESGAREWDAYTPPGPKRHGFDFWYSYGAYDQHLKPHYWKDTPEMIQVEQWSLEHETDVALDFIRTKRKETEKDNGPFALFVSWNPPHSPFELVPERYKEIYGGRELSLRPNVSSGRLAAHTGEPFESGDEALDRYTRDYFAAVSGMDEQFGRIWREVEQLGIAENTLIVLSSDHGELMGSHGLMAKHSWHEESIAIPCLMSWKGVIEQGSTNLLFNSVDIMPTLLGLAGIPVPAAVEGMDLSGDILGTSETDISSAFISGFPGRKDAMELFAASGLDNRRYGWRGIRTSMYTYVVHRGYAPGAEVQRLFYEHEKDPYQLNPVVLYERPQTELLISLEKELQSWLDRTMDRFDLG
ncbi:sulfatase [Paenibacillus sp. CGMCC 1.16610]|uniref:Sulfatase-like hydrolase/transferase n=1 Tax=Paenibacillus anseongense TaxID=2682845 RepID=A0ABW9U290_9BACL|nr:MULTISPECIES: sulfatase [Paenibacillus]MBA2936828.1 sulfatase [Paenibacillus sp. CGMCC 1.16610]MVQ33156.1 sulfatase-like hydrolase/transferase [Paenibacillus anseongense]